MAVQRLNISGGVWVPLCLLAAFVSTCICVSLFPGVCLLSSVSFFLCSSVSSRDLHLFLSPPQASPHLQSPRPLPKLPGNLNHPSL